MVPRAKPLPLSVELLFDGATQIYYNMSEESSIFKRIIIEFLDYLKYKVESDSLTMEDTEAIARTFEDNLDLITTVIDRNFLPKPRRLVAYRFKDFRRVKPKGWTITTTAKNH